MTPTLIFYLFAFFSTTAQGVGATQTPTEETHLTPFLQGGKYGYIDTTGRTVIEPQFSFASNFSEGLAEVCDARNCGYLNQTGELVIPMKFESGDPFRDGFASVRVCGKVGFINSYGNFVIPAVFDAVDGYGFVDGLAAVRVGEKWGYIDKTGSRVIAPKFSEVTRFSDGRASVHFGKNGDKMWFIDTRGEMIFPLTAGSSEFSEGLAPMAQNRLYGFADTEGHTVIPAQFDYVVPFSESLAGVVKDARWGFIAKNGRMVITPQFDYASRFHAGMAVVEVSGKYGYINKDGHWVVEPQFVWAGDFEDGLARVLLTTQESAFIDQSGRVVWRSAEKQYRELTLAPKTKKNSCRPQG